MTNQDQAARVIDKNLPITERIERHAHAYIIADALKEAGLLAPELPEPNDPSIFVPNGKGWAPGGPQGPSVWTAPDSPIMVQRIEPGELTPNETRGVAYSMLAAANYSEGSNA